MKKIILLGLVIAIHGASYSQQGLKINLIGTWKGTDSTNKTGYMKFIDSANIIFFAPDQDTLTGIYKIDMTKDPIWLDITTTKDNFKKTLPGFLMIIDANTIKWQVFFDGKRPEKPVKEYGDNTLTFTRITQ
jgi:hypothetical protein